MAPPLISAEELRAIVGQLDVRIADVRWKLGQLEAGRDAYVEGHIPGAVFIDLETDLSAPEGPGRHPLPDPGTFAARLGQLGFGSGHRIVAYDDASGTVAARLWWMLDRLGHEAVSVLDGGLAAWRAAGGDVVRGEESYPPARLELRSNWSETIERDDLVRRLALGRASLVDLRARERYRGDVEPVDPVAGHIPGARSLPSTDLLDERGRLRPADELRASLAGAIEPGADPILSCGSGVTACFGTLAARVAGLPDPTIYGGSFSDWSTAGLPVATGDEPGGLTEPPDAAGSEAVRT